MAGEGLLLGALIWLLAVAFFRSRKAPSSAAPDPAASFYHPYTTRFDRVCGGSELRSLLDADGKDIRAGRAVGTADPAARERMFHEAHERATAGLNTLAGLDGTAVCVLVDQSGSMARFMPAVAGELLAACEDLEAVGADVMLAGFTTIGWRGGQTRALWDNEGRPPYPGRLCDLLHVIYSGFGEASTATLFAPLLDQGIFFENVDGEAICWAEQALLAVPQPRRCLIVVSDGAPVDDSSLFENGPSFLWNHLVQTLDGLHSRGQIAVGGIGINHDVSSLYAYARQVSPDGGLAAEIVQLAALLAVGEGGSARS